MEKIRNIDYGGKAVFLSRVGDFVYPCEFAIGRLYPHRCKSIPFNHGISSSLPASITLTENGLFDGFCTVSDWDCKFLDSL